MKSYFLESIASDRKAEELLRELLPGQERPWLLRDASGDAMAYFNLEVPDGSELDPALKLELPAVVADISGRHFNCDAEVLAVLRTLQASVGGRIAEDSDDN